MGVWIETLNSLTINHLPVSLLMWECGLKLGVMPDGIVGKVTPYVGVWIETLKYQR